MADNTVQNLRQVIEKGQKIFDIATEIVEGQTPEDVLIEDGTTRPNWTKRVAELLNDITVYGSASDGLSNAVEGQYFGVIVVNSDGIVTYDLYQKKGGQAVLRLSGMTGAGDGISFDSTGNYSLQSMSSMELTSNTRNWNSFTQVAGNLSANNFSVSELIPVKKGQCFFLGYTGDWGLGVDNYVAFYDSNSNAVGSLVYTRYSEPAFNAVSIDLPNYNSEERLRKRYFRVPRDGYIRLSSPTSNVSNFYLGEVSFDTFIQEQYSPIAQLNMKGIDALGYAYSPIYTLLGGEYDKDSGGNWQQTQFGNHAASELIPVKAGQYLSSITAGFISLTAAYIYNANKEITGSVADFNPLAASRDKTHGLRSTTNYKIPQDGYIQIATDVAVSSLTDQALVWVSDDFYELIFPFATSQGDIARINGYQNTMQLGASYSQNDAFDTFAPIYLDVGSYLRVDIAVTNETGSDFYPVTVSAQSQVNIDNGRVYTQGMSDFTSDQQSVKGQVYPIFIYADRYPLIVNVNTAAGTGGVRLLSRDQWIQERNEHVATLKPVPVAQPYGANLHGNAGRAAAAAIGFIPLLPNEVAVFKGNSSYMRAFNYIVDPNAASDGIVEDLRPRRQTSAVGTLTTKESVIYRYRNFNQFNYLGVNITTRRDDTGGVEYDGSDTSWVDSYIGDDVVQVITADEFEARYKDGEAWPQAYSRDTFINTAWNDSTTCTRHAHDSTTFDNNNTRQLLPISIQKGECYHWKMNIGKSRFTRTPFVVYFDDNNLSNYSYKALCDVGPQPNGDIVSPQPMEGYFQAEHDGFIYLQERRQGDDETDVEHSPEFRLYDAHKQLELYWVSEDVYRQNTEITFTDRCLYLSNAEGLEFRMINGPMPYDRDGYEYRYPCQVWQAGKHLTTFMLKTGVQGQSTAGTGHLKTNIDVKGENANGDKIKFKIGDWQETNKLAFKANDDEKTGIRDTVGNHLWRNIRRYGYTYPNNQIADSRLFDKDMSKYSDLRFINDADYSMRGTPCAVLYGGMIYGLYQLRTKKDELNYGIIADDNDFILLQSDYRSYSDAHGGAQHKIDWLNFTYRAWEVTQPESALPDDYEVGDTPADATVDSSIKRVFDFIANCSKGTDGYDFDADAEKYINMASLIDYGIHGQVIRGWDNNVNNLIMTTYNGTDDESIWTFHFYDMDQTLGANVDQHPYSYDDITTAGMDGRNKPWQLIVSSSKYWQQAKDRYAALRNGPLAINNLMSLVDEESRKVPERWRKEDIDAWGDTDINSTQYIKNWLQKRLGYTDDYFEYEAS